MAEFVVILYAAGLLLLAVLLALFLPKTNLRPSFAQRVGNLILIMASVPLLLKPELPEDFVLMPAMVGLSSTLALFGT